MVRWQRGNPWQKWRRQPEIKNCGQGRRSLPVAHWSALKTGSLPRDPCQGARQSA